MMLGITLMVVVGCGKQQHSTYINPIDLVLDTTLVELSDSFLVPPQVRCIDCSNDFLYFTDYTDGLIIIDKNYHIQKQVGSRGQGPEELLGTAHFCFGSNDSIYILNEGNRSVKVFVNGVYNKNIPFPENVRLTFNTRFFVDKGKIYHSVINEEFPVIAFNNDTTQFMCTYIPYDNPILGHHATKHMIKGDNSFFLIGCVYPTLEQYSLNGKKLKDFDLNIIPEISKMTKAYHNASNEPNSYFTVIQDAYYHKGCLYLLIGLLNDDNYCCNTIAVLDVSTTEWEYTNCYHLSGNVYDTFCVDDRNMYLHDSSRSCLDVFHLLD